MMASKGWKAVQAHVPLIRFRKGGINRAVTGATVPSKSQSGPPSIKIRGATGPSVVPLPFIKDYQLPHRFHRRPLDSKEIEYINVRILE